MTSALADATDTADAWVDAVARELETEDREFAYSVLRSWLHMLRNRVAVESAARFARALPDPIRAVFYADWNPAAAPAKPDPKAYIIRFARGANIAVQEAGAAAAATTAAVLRLLPPIEVCAVLGQLSNDLRAVIDPAHEAEMRWRSVSAAEDLVLK